MDDLGLLDLWPQEGLGPTFLTTFVFDAHLFERFLYPELESRGAFPVVVFLDYRSGYRPTFEVSHRVQGTNCSYQLVPVGLQLLRKGAQGRLRATQFGQCRNEACGRGRAICSEDSRAADSDDLLYATGAFGKPIRVVGIEARKSAANAT